MNTQSQVSLRNAPCCIDLAVDAQCCRHVASFLYGSVASSNHRIVVRKQATVVPLANPSTSERAPTMQGQPQSVGVVAHYYGGELLHRLTYYLHRLDIQVAVHRPLSAPGSSRPCLVTLCRELLIVVHVSSSPRPNMHANPQNSLAAGMLFFLAVNPSNHYFTLRFFSTHLVTCRTS